MKRMSRWTAVVAFSGLALLGLVGCKPSDAVKQGAVVGNGMKPASAPLDPASVGTISGTVHFAGKPPARVKIDMSQDPACSMAPGDNYSEQYVVHDGKLANVYVYIKSGPAVAMTVPSTSTTPVVVDQVGCKYAPHVVALMRGGKVEFRNSDSTMHNIHTMPVVVGEKATDVSQGPKGTPQWVDFKDPEMMVPVRCNNHPWMNAFINVADTPFFAVTDADGHFEIKGLPAGDYVLAVLHEKLGEQTMNVTVKPLENENAYFSYAAK
jgi:plastocyanin